MITRRDLLVSAGALLLLGCDQGKVPESCDDVSGLKEDERAPRVALGYVDRGPDPTHACARCQQWVAPPERSACGGCKLLKGPIHPLGTCRAFALRG